MFDLKNKVAVITGGANGLGYDAAQAFVKQGAKVAIIDRDEDALTRAESLLILSGGDVCAFSCDLTNEIEVKQAVAQVIIKFSRIDILLNNAGILRGGTVENIPEKVWDLSMNVNVKSMFLVCKQALPFMKKQGFGRIINMSSFNAKITDKTDEHARHAYIASKAAVLGLTSAMAATYGKYGITVNALLPGYFETNITKGILFNNKTVFDAHNDVNPTGRTGKKGELNGIIMFLSSDESSYITGEHIRVDGGLSII